MPASFLRTKIIIILWLLYHNNYFIIIFNRSSHGDRCLSIPKYQSPRLFPIAATYLELMKEIEAVRSEVNDILADQNDINESTRAQLDAISTALAELQAKPADSKTRRPIGFIQPKDDEEEK